MEDRRPSGKASKRDEGPSGLRRLGVWAGGAIAVLLALYLAAVLAVRTLVPPDRLARWAEPRAEAVLNREVDIGGADLAIFPHLGLELREVRVGNLADFEGPPLLRVESAELRVALLPLLRGRVVVDEAAAVGPVVRLQVDEDGVSNFGDLVPASEDVGPDGPGGGLPISLTIREVTVDRGRVEYHDRRTGRRVAADSLRARGRLSRVDGGRELRLRGSTPGLRVELPGFRDEAFGPDSASARLRLRSGDRFRRLEVVRGTVSVAGLSASVAGRVDSLRSSRRRLSLRLTADSVELGRVARSWGDGDLPGSLESLEGVLSLRLGLAGPAGPDATPSPTGRLRLRGGRASLAGRGTVAGPVSALLRARNDSLLVERVEGTVLGGPLRLTGGLALDSARRWSGRLESTASVSALAPAGAADRPSGTVETSLELSGRAGEPASTRARGEAVLRRVVLPRDSARAEVRLPEGSLAFRGDSVSWAGIAVAVGEDELRVTGRLDRWPALLGAGETRPWLRGSVESARLDLDRLRGRPEETPGYGRLAFARLGGDSVGGRPAPEAAREHGYGRPASLPLAGSVELDLDTLLLRPYRFEDVAARLEFGPDRVRLADARFRLFGGRVRQSVSLALGGGARPFTFSLTGRGLRAADFLAASSPLGRVATGTMDLELEAAGLLDPNLLPDRDSLIGRGLLTLRGGGLAENPVTGAVAGLMGYAALRSPAVDRGVVPFRLEGTSVAFDTARLSTAAGRLDWTGSVDLAGGVDVGLRLRVPRSRLAEIDLEGTGLPARLVDRLRGGSGPLELGLRMGGSLDAPELSVDADALRTRAEEAAGEAARERLRQGLERGRQLLEERGRRLVPGRGTDTASTAPEGAAADTASGAGPGLRPDL